MGALWPMLRRAAFWPAILAFMVFIGFLYIPDQWAAFTAWHLYLDRLDPLFLTATSFAARAAMGAMAALWLLLLFTFVFLLFLRTPTAYLAVEDSAARNRWGMSLVDADIVDELTAAASAPAADPMLAPSPSDGGQAPDRDVPLRNRWDLHPDDAPRAPLSAERELPAGGLTAMRSEASEPAAPLESTPASPIAAPAQNAPEIPSASPPRKAEAEEAEPWLQPVERSGPPNPAAHDVSLAALVQRLEARLARRRRPAPIAEPAVPPAPVPVPETPPMTVSDHSIDLALEAALGTLQRMNLRAVG